VTPWPTYDVILCHGKVGDDIFNAAAFEVPRSYDLSATAQLAYALRCVKDEGTVMVRFAGRLQDQPHLYELVYSVLPWFAKLVVYRVDLYAGHTMAYLVLKSYKYPIVRSTVEGRVNFELVMSAHEFQVGGFLHGLYLAVSHPVPARIAPDFGLVQGVANSTHGFLWVNSTVKYVRWADRLQFVAGPRRLQREATNEKLSAVRGGGGTVNGALSYMNWDQSRRNLMEWYRGKFQIGLVPTFRLCDLIKAPSVSVAQEIQDYYVGESGLAGWRKKHEPGEEVLRIVWDYLRGEDGPVCSRHIIHSTGVLVSEEKLDWVLSVRLLPIPGLGVPQWSLSHQVGVQASPFLIRRSGVPGVGSGPDLSLSDDIRLKHRMRFKQSEFKPSHTRSGEEAVDPSQYLQYSFDHRGDVVVPSTKYRDKVIRLEEFGVGLLAVLKEAFFHIPPKFTLEQFCQLLRTRWQIAADPDTLYLCLAKEGLIQEIGNNYFMRPLQGAFP